MLRSVLDLSIWTSPPPAHSEETQRMNPYQQWYRCISCKSCNMVMMPQVKKKPNPESAELNFSPTCMYVNPFTAKSKLDSTKTTSKSWTTQRNLKVSTLKWPGWESYQDLAKILRDHAWLAKILQDPSKILARFESVIMQDLAGSWQDSQPGIIGGYEYLQVCRGKVQKQSTLNLPRTVTLSQQENQGNLQHKSK